MQFLVTIVLESSLTELESSAIAFLLVTIELESSTIQFLLVTITIRELSNSVLTSKNMASRFSLKYTKCYSS